MNLANTAFMAASGGSITVNDATTKSVGFWGVELASGTVVTELLNKEGVDVTSTYITTPATAMIKDTLIRHIGEGYFTSITIEAGGQADLILR